MPDDAGVGEQPLDVALRVARDDLRVEASNASRNATRLRRIVIHDSPAWKPSRHSSSNSARSSRSGRAPLAVVVGDVERVVAAPPAPGDAVVAQRRAARAELVTAGRPRPPR